MCIAKLLTRKVIMVVYVQNLLLLYMAFYKEHCYGNLPSSYALYVKHNLHDFSENL